MQKLSAEKQRLYVENQKRKVDRLVEESEEAYAQPVLYERTWTDKQDRHDEPRGSVELEQVQTQQQVQQ